ncbi:hypothetical protein SJAV_17730 [Sulfurisphaera javensis]|uniref:Uncharacterized protein n=1 Tax=Sulfurisphaera javensis TaxID=2049879 RepID=A0AAT9GSE1_9CREN
MQLIELVELISSKKREFSKDKIEYELRKTLNDLSSLRKSLEKIRDIKGKMLFCNDLIKDEKERILNSNDPEYISKLIDIMYEKVIACYRKMEEEKRKKIEEETKEIREINTKLLLYKKILKNIFNENIDIYMLNDKSEDLEEEIKKGKEELTQLYNVLKSKAGENLELLIELVDNNEIEIDSRNYDEVIELIKFLVSKGISLSLRFSK